MPPRLLFLLLGWLAGCTVYSGAGSGYGPYGQLAAGNRPPTYRTIAILPIRVSEVHLRGFTQAPPPDTTAATRHRAARRCQQLAYQLQTALAAQLPRSGCAVWLQPIRETNLRLAQAGITYDNLPGQPATRLQQVLGTDAVLLGQTVISKLPLSVQLASDLLMPNKLGGFPATLASTSLSLHDQRSEQPVWQASFSSSERGTYLPGAFSELATRVMHTMPATFPYR